jgi:hypothetical protein
MFGLPGFPKLMLIAAVIAVVWYFMRRGQVARRDSDPNLAGTGRPSTRAKQTAAKHQKPIEDMVQCKACGSYVPAKSGCSCGQGAR